MTRDNRYIPYTTPRFQSVRFITQDLAQHGLRDGL
jgi:hypothetical protein